MRRPAAGGFTPVLLLCTAIWLGACTTGRPASTAHGDGSSPATRTTIIARSAAAAPSASSTSAHRAHRRQHTRLQFVDEAQRCGNMEQSSLVLEAFDVRRCWAIAWKRRERLLMLGHESARPSSRQVLFYTASMTPVLHINLPPNVHQPAAFARVQIHCVALRYRRTPTRTYIAFRPRNFPRGHIVNHCGSLDP
jgi:hypothetical protein